tara:strand:+ start:3569 stop:3778 length:210 start_codon:yes stop_codon:yes gene_type:complete
MVMGFFKKAALKSVMDKAKELYEKGNAVDEIALKFWENEKVADGLRLLNISTDELVKMIKDKVGDKKED